MFLIIVACVIFSFDPVCFDQKRNICLYAFIFCFIILNFRLGIFACFNILIFYCGRL